MAKGRKTGGRDFKKGEGGRKPGSKNSVPASLKASLKVVLDEIEAQHAGDIEAGLLAGIRAKPPVSFPYIQLALAYQLGKPVHRVHVVEPQPIEIHLYNDPA